MDLDTSLEELSWIPRPRILALRRLALGTVGDLLRHYPRRHEDRREFRGFPREETSGPVCLCGEGERPDLFGLADAKFLKPWWEEGAGTRFARRSTVGWLI